MPEEQPITNFLVECNDQSKFVNEILMENGTDYHTQSHTHNDDHTQSITPIIKTMQHVSEIFFTNLKNNPSGKKKKQDDN